MEGTFILKKDDLNTDFIESVKKIFGNAKQLQITISSSEDFGLLASETSEEYTKRLTKAAEDVEHSRNLVVRSEEEIDEMVISRL